MFDEIRILVKNQSSSTLQLDPKKGKRMYKLMSVGRAKGGKLRETIGAMKALAEYINSKHNLNAQVHIQQFRPPELST